MPKEPQPKEESFNLADLEKETLAFWDKHKIFEKSLEKTADGKPFTFYDGPPFATGLPHYGHILASTIKDVVPRYQTMHGRFVRRRWGWDCHGLPIEEIVERKLGISGKKQIEEVGIKTFNETCRSMVLQYVSEWRSMVHRVARWVDFDNSYKTMDSDYMESVWWAFKQIYDKGLIYEGRKVLLYCPRCETPVSNFEVAMDNSYKDVAEESVFVKFKVKSGQKIGNHIAEPSDVIYILAWTTTPWTLPGNIALAVGSGIEYRAVSHGGEYIIVAADRLKDLGLEDPGAEHALTGAQLVGLEYEPLFEVPSMKSEKSYKVYAADFVTTEEGTGIVHTAVVYGEDDYALGVREELPVVPLLNERGIFNDKAPELVRGQYFKKTDAIVIADLESRNLLFKKMMHTHSYPFCWRCGTALFYNAIPAWFVNIQKIKPQLLQSNDKAINWFPEHLKHGRYEKSVEAAPDWNISRNRYWGNPIPVWKCGSCDRHEVIGSLEELSKRSGGSKNSYWVMRHGEAESNMFDIVDSGQRKFLHLTPRGKEQAEKSALRFHKELEKNHRHIDLIIDSDITRTAETAAIAGNILGVKTIIVDKTIEEIHLGPTLTGYRDEKYQERFPTYESRFHERPEGGESLRDVRTRLWEFMKRCEAEYSGKNILIVTHDYPTWMLTQIAEGWNEKRAIAEKEKRGVPFIDFAEVRELTVKNIPRNDTGEADMHRPYIDEVVFPCTKCNGKMQRTPEIFDSWMEAGSMPFAEYHYPFENKKTFEKRLPAQFVAEYIAQTRAWFYVMHVISQIIFGKAPFENVVTTGTILAEDGSKMSKSKGNFPDPKLVIDKYGADSLRFYLMNSVVMQADNLNFSEQAVATIYRKVALILWNVTKFFTTYVEPGDLSPMVDRGSAAATAHEERSDHVLDRWIGIRTRQLVSSVTAAMDAYDTVRATRTIQEYIDDLSTWYLRRSRKRNEPAFFAAFYESLLKVSVTIAPFMPFLAEELYQALKPYHASDAAMSVHLVDWPVSHKKSGAKKLPAKVTGDEEALLHGMIEVRRLASLALSKRVELGIKVRQPLAKLTIKNASLNAELCAILAEEVNVKSVVADAALKDDVELDSAITPELREEGLLREVIRMVQGLRQEADLQPGDEIVAMFELAAPVRIAIEHHEALLKKEIGARVVEYRRSDKFTAEQMTKLDGTEVWAGIRKV